uniref:Large ribosomal subunit protein uL4c n=1 Tax=Laurencia australis TaxID=3073067 RepID=A0AA51NF60_9FLOR|nr:50S ribosomal protein L4 [Laurencia australis]WMP12089.1 50S ribosomal protein L4 [Laurencia australis]
MTIIKTITYTVENEKNEINSETIGLKISEDKKKQMYCIHRSLKNQLKNGRIRNANTKTRSEVRGGGKKPWKQKGTGRARVGSTRSPLWKGGGVIFGPKRAKYTSKINKKEKDLAISTLLYNKISKTKIVDCLLITTKKPNTKNALETLRNININVNKYKNILIIVEKKTKLIYLSFRNISNIELIEAKNLNILSLLKAEIIVITRQSLKTINTK